MKIAVLNVYGHLNAGDAVLLESLEDMIKHSAPEATLVGIAYDPSTQQRWSPNITWSERIGNGVGPRQVARVFQVLCVALAVVSARFNFLRPLSIFLPLRQRQSFNELLGSDLAIACPGGYLEDSNHAYLINLANIYIAACLCPKTVMAPQSIGPINSWFGKKVAAFVLNSVDAIFVRERASLDFVAALQVNQGAAERKFPTVRLAGDLAFWYARGGSTDLAAHLAELGISSGDKFIGLTVVDWTFPASQSKSKARANYLEALVGLADHIQARGEHKILLFNQVSADLPFARILHKECPFVLLDQSERESAIFAELTGRCEAFIGTRFHSCIFALLKGVPTGAISYLPKTSGIMEALGLSDFVVDIEGATANSLIGLYNRLIADNASVRSRVTGAVASYQYSGGDFGSWLQNEISA